jgi:hypothetical protein
MTLLSPGAGLGAVCMAMMMVGTSGVSATEFSLRLSPQTAVHAIVDGPNGEPPTREVRRWIQRAAKALLNYAGGLPVPDVFVAVSADGGPGVHGGRAFATDPPSVSVRLGKQTTRAQFERDWVLTHELVHVMVPDLPSKHL